jgi:release factor glutamine methyltransferase
MPRLDAEVLLCAALSVDRAALYTRLSEPAADAVNGRFEVLLSRRLRREPLAYITGVQEFWSLPFAVTPGVLIPRPETELLVETVVELSAGRVSPLICEIGTGSSCVAVALARELPTAWIVATDISAEALAVARRNAAAHGVESRIDFVLSDLYGGFRERRKFEFVVSNPPYVSSEDALSPELAWEPRSALLAGTDGLEVIRPLLHGAARRLAPDGWLVMEFGCGQVEAVQGLAADAGFRPISVRSDLAGIPRALLAQTDRRAIR